MKRGARQRRPTGILADQGGAAAVEFALLLTLFTVLVAGLIDFGTGLWEAMMVGNAARAGAYYASVKGYSQSNIESAVTSATELGSNISASPAPSQQCLCPSSTGTGLVAPPGTAPTPPICGGTLCSDGVTAAGYYIQVNAQMPYTLLIPWPGWGNPITLKATSYARLD